MNILADQKRTHACKKILLISRNLQLIHPLLLESYSYIFVTVILTDILIVRLSFKTKKKFVHQLLNGLYGSIFSRAVVRPIIGEGGIFIYLCSARRICFESDCFYGM